MQFAKTLRGKISPSECEILLFNSKNHMVFHVHPLLADVAGASINVDAAATPSGRYSPRLIAARSASRESILLTSQIAVEDGSGVLNRLHCDHVVIACGAESNLRHHPGDD